MHCVPVTDQSFERVAFRTVVTQLPAAAALSAVPVPEVPGAWYALASDGAVRVAKYAVRSTA
jgi:hypothetical protein